MFFRVTLCIALLAFGLPLLADAVRAQGQGTAQQRSACMMDAFRFCMSSIPNHKKIESCLRSNRRSLSASCYAEIYDESPASTGTVKKVVEGSNHAPE